MEKKNLSIIGLLERELQLRNYSPRTVHTYVELVKRTENHIGITLCTKLQQISTKTTSTSALQKMEFQHLL